MSGKSIHKLPTIIMNSNELEWIKKIKKELHFLKLLKKSELQIMNDELISSKTESYIK